jgi:hypothetical protein
MSGLRIETRVSEDGSSNDQSHATRRSPWTDRLVARRESFLDLITSTQPGAVLNEGETGLPANQAVGSDLTADLKRFMDMTKMEAIDEQGYSVDYKRLKESPAYREYRKRCSPRLRDFDPRMLSTRDEKLAFWINLYNALIMDGVIAKEVTESVGSNPLALLGFFRQTAYDVAGLRMNADDIEHGILRGNQGHPMIPGPQFASQDARLAWMVNPVDVRIHFALNCAGRSCPPIQVYTPEKIDQQLDLAARNFVDADVQIDQDRNTAQLSAIFNWFGKDFGGQRGVINFLIEHLPQGERKTWLLEHRDTIAFQYKTYDWGLNSSHIPVTSS